MNSTPGPILDALTRRPDHIWIAGSTGLFGWGVASRVDVGSGPGRYRRAFRGLEQHGGVAFASFTFDPEIGDSHVIVPETVVRADAKGLDLLYGELPQPYPSAGIPDAATERPSDQWDTSFARAMESLHDGQIEKIVLSRTIDLSFEAQIPIAEVVANLFPGHDGSHVFAVEGLVGSSPELLASLDGNRFVSVSLAGSSSIDDGNIDDLLSPKNKREHELAADSVASALAPLSAEVSRSQTHRATFGDIAHLATRFEGLTLPGTTVLDLVARLHPTAAVAGTPTKTAMRLIRLLEGHQRGRYAGPVGWFDTSGNGDFAIALRCGQITDRQMTLYSGAGLVSGSICEAEYAETELKLQPMLRALEVK